ncbi:unnamed protein product [Spodoptera littoralis]|uniref:FXNA-like protease n=1 Tax=Spodoptera littoralis TaxID=7109 RepID=A0A9P0N429_SPOLI|nr:unnamed protein product [Spodoptera littoralis]CAH1641702.1 unnamed protein product [Spodoptera littoralis]
MIDPDKPEPLPRTRRLAATHNYGYTGVPTIEYEDERVEKPWQRVVGSLTKKGTHLNNPIKSVPSTLLIVVLGLYLLLGYLTQLVEDAMPSVILDKEVAVDDAFKFSEEAALKYLTRIVGDEPRVSGTPYHLNRTKDLKMMLDDIASGAHQKVHTDWQIATGDYFHQSASSFYNVYENASNIVALLEGESGFLSNGSLGSSILVNCHYDSVPFALGASDNAVFCAIMAESLNRLSRSKQKLKHNILFLFNGAEENGLQASHAFLQHPWARGAVAVINLDAAGMNGKPTIFQVTDPRVLQAYHRSAPRPNAQGMAEFIFSNGIIPSDTDFRIWRDFGNIQGIDIAFVKWASVYHTRNDKPSLLQAGVLQGAGDMMLGLLTETASMQELENKIQPSAAVYYDYLNLFLINYSLFASYFVDVLIALLGLSSVTYYVWIVGFRWSTVMKLLLSAFSRVLAMLIGVAVVFVFTFIMVATTVQLRYVSEPWLVVPLYWVPYLIVAVAVSQGFDAYTFKTTGLTRSLRCAQAMAATRLLVSVTLLVLCCVPALTSLRYIFSAPLFILSVTSLASLTILRFVALRGWQHLVLELSLSVPSSMWALSLALRLDAQILPVMARSAGDKPDVTVAMINLALVILVACTVSGIELLFSRKFLWLVLSVSGAACVVLMFIPFSPYDGDGIALQRHYWFHSQISSYDINGKLESSTSGIVVTKHDAYSAPRVLRALSAAGYNLESRTGFSEDCEKQVFCGLPLFRTGFSRFLKDAMLLSTGPPATFAPPAATRVANKSCGGDECKYSFVFTGAHHNMITLWPRTNVSLTSWSLSTHPQSSAELLQRPVFVIYHSTATYFADSIDYYLDVTFNVPASLQSQPIVDISHHSHKIYHPEQMTAEYRAILDAMPRYFNVATFLSFRNNYVF